MKLYQIVKTIIILVKIYVIYHSLFHECFCRFKKEIKDMHSLRIPLSISLSLL